MGLHEHWQTCDDEDDHADHPRRVGDVGAEGRVQSRVSSATAFLAQSSSTSALPAVVAAMSAAVAALLSARGSPRLALCSRAIASSANNGSVRPTSARWWRKYWADSARSIGTSW